MVKFKNKKVCKLTFYHTFVELIKRDLSEVECHTDLWVIDERRSSSQSDGMELNQCTVFSGNLTTWTEWQLRNAKIFGQSKYAKTTGMCDQKYTKTITNRNERKNSKCVINI